MQACIGKLELDLGAYLEEQAKTIETFRSRFAELGQAVAEGEAIVAANADAAADIQKTLAEVKQIDLSAAEAGTILLTRCSELLATCRHLRDRHDRAFLAIAVALGRMAGIDPRLHTDPLTGLQSRIGLESGLAQWWQEGRQRLHETGAILVDLDGLGPINAEHGSAVGDRILQGVAQLLWELGDPHSIIAHFAGQRFLAAIYDISPKTLVKTAELIRQSVERTTFQLGRQPIRLTATVTVAAVLPEESIAALLARCEQTLATAKETQRNRTVFHNGKETQAIEPSELGAEHREIAM